MLPAEIRGSNKALLGPGLEGWLIRHQRLQGGGTSSQPLARTFQQKLGGSGENKGGREVLFEQHNNNTMYE